jgi:serine/threonine protein kinase
VSGESAGNGLDITFREFVAGQKLFNRYTLIKTLGRGGMGVVWLARDDELERDVALKFLPDLIIHDRAVLGDLKRETRRSLELTHKNIVRIYDFVHDQTSGCISMEYVDGDTLSNLRADKPRKVFEPDELTDWTSQLCDALDYAHNHARIVHRDLKPANLMVNQRGDLKVADFGIARSLSDSVSKLTMQHGKSGTLVYMSPQQLDGERGTHLDDVYSLGASVYELLTSKPPFYSGNVDRQIREKIPPSLTDRRKELEVEGDPIDAAWEEVVAKCLAKNPDRRPQSVAEIAKRLEVPSPKTRRAKRAAGADGSSKKWLGVLATAVVLSILAAGGWYLFQKMQKPTAERSTPAPAPPTAQNLSPNEFVDGFVNSLAINDVTAQVEWYADKVSYYDSGRTSKEAVRRDLEHDITKWPNRVYSLRSAPKIDQISPQVYRADFPMSYTLTNGKEESTGTLQMTATFDLSAGRGKILSIQRKVVVAQKAKPTDLSTTEIKQIQPAETTAAPSERKVAANSIYEGTIRAKNESGGFSVSATNVPLAITFGSDLKSGTMTQSGRRGDVVVKFAGMWDGATLHAVTDQVVSVPKGINWEPESFTLHFADDGKSATYECVADGKTYVADLSAQSAPAVKAAPIYKGTILARGEKGSGTPLTINLAADRKSGTMTQTSKSGDTVVRFNGIWDGDILRAVTNEVISKPTNVQWKPESFTLRFADDGKRGSYECNSEGRFYTAELTPP